MNLYKLKRAVLTPYVLYKRHKERHQTSPFIKAALELHYYRPTFYRFIGARHYKPDLLHDVPIDGESVVLDVGAHVGDWSDAIIQRYHPRLYLFEPDPAHIPRLAERYADDPRVTLFDFGLHDRDAVLALEQKGLGSTTFRENATGKYPVVEVRLRDVASVLCELGHAEVDLLKINIEGGEYEVLERLIETQWVSRIRCFMIQYHEWRDGAHFRRFRIQRAMRRTHRIDWDYPFVWERWTRR